ncbi:MAG: hypothetical protein CSA62_02410 [Planctomycetota bacterium]|nr:MAG: hypothetical protein CSA62_02410 [Planctomycetota bacterium]
MPAFLSQVVSQLKNLWLEFTGGQRLIVSAVLAATLVGMAALIWVGTRPSFDPLPIAVSRDESPGVISLLTKANINFRVEATGSISVDSGDMQSATRLLIEEGYMDGGANDLKELQSGTMTRSQEMNRHFLLYSRAKRIERQIAGMRGVRSAIVSVHQPRSTPFVGRKGGQKSSASVTLTVSANANFNKLASSAVGIVAKGLGLPRESVIVTSNMADQYLESQEGGGRGLSGFSELLALEMKNSSMKTGIAQARLNEIWPGKATVQVNVSYKNEIGSKQTVLTPSDKQVVEETKFSSSSKKPGQGSSAAEGDSTEQTQSKKTYLSNIGKEVMTQLAPSIDQVSVSLILDESLKDQSAAITEQVKNIVGWKQGRDQPFTAIVTKFPDFSDIEVESGGAMQMFKEYAPLVGQILSVILVLFFLRGLLKRTRTAIGPVGPGTMATATSGAGEEDGAEEEDSGKEAKRLRREIERVVAADPGSVTRLLESWLTEKVNN